ncbi:MAG: hypothetical protein Q9169_003889 [Polycauliona sp. 2 TL-2023]
MLQQALVSPTAKLEISKLLESSPSPSPPPPSTVSIPSFSRSFSGPSVATDPLVGRSPTTSPTSCFPALPYGSASLDTRRPSGTGPPPSLSIPASSIKRTASTSPQESRHTSKKPARQWSDADSHKLLKLRGANTTWLEIAHHFPGRTDTGCRLRYQNYLEKKYGWTEEKKKSLAVLYERYVTARQHLVGFVSVLILPVSRKHEMWQPIADDLVIPWRAVEDMHWAIGQENLVSMGGGKLLHPDRSGSKQDPGGSRTSFVSATSAVGPPPMQAHFVSAPTSTFSRHPSQPGAMLGQPPPLATTNGYTQPRYLPGGEDTGFGFHRTHRRQSSGGGQLPSLAEMERGIPAYAAQGRGHYRDDDDYEEVETKEELEEELERGQR